MKNTDERRILSVQGLRAIACICVFLAHSWGASNDFLSSMISDLGRLGVLTFFLLSGVLTSRKLQRATSDNAIKDGIKYAINKIIKIYPLYILTTLVMLIITFDLFFLVEWVQSKIGMIARLGLHILLLQSYVPRLGVAYSFNGPAWFLSVCLLLWLLTPMIIKVLKRINREWYPFLGIVLFVLQLCYLIVVFNLHLAEQRWFMYVFPLINLLIYIQGILWGGVHLPDKRYFGIDAFVILLFQYLIKDFIPVDFRVIWLEPVVLCLVLAVRNDKDYLSTVLARHPIVFIGNISMEIFLIHYSVLHFIGRIFSVAGVKQPEWIFIFEFLTTVFLALGWKLIVDCRERNRSRL